MKSFIRYLSIVYSFVDDKAGLISFVLGEGGMIRRLALSLAGAPSAMIVRLFRGAAVTTLRTG